MGHSDLGVIQRGLSDLGGHSDLGNQKGSLSKLYFDLLNEHFS